MEQEHIRPLSPSRFGDWLERQTQRLQAEKVSAEGGCYELDRARRLGKLDTWAIEGTWQPQGNEAIAPTVITSSGRCTLVQFSVEQLDDGRPSEKPRSKVWAFCADRLPALASIFANLQAEIEQNWPAERDLIFRLKSGEIKNPDGLLSAEQNRWKVPADPSGGAYKTLQAGPSGSLIQMDTPNGPIIAWATESIGPTSGAAAQPEPNQAADVARLPPLAMQKLILDAYHKLSAGGANRVSWDKLRDELTARLGQEPASKPILRQQVYAMWEDPKARADIEARGLQDVIHKPPKQ